MTNKDLYTDVKSGESSGLVLACIGKTKLCVHSYDSAVKSIVKMLFDAFSVLLGLKVVTYSKNRCAAVEGGVRLCGSQRPKRNEPASRHYNFSTMVYC